MRSKIFVVLASVNFLGACTSQLDCASNEAQNLIVEISKENQLLVKNWELIALSLAAETEKSLRDKSKKDLSDLQKSLHRSQESVESIRKECRNNLNQSPSVIKIKEQINSISAEYGEIERSAPNYPPRKPIRSQQDADNWRAAEMNYNADVEKRKIELMRLSDEKRKSSDSLQISENFIHEVCEKGVTNKSEKFSVISMPEIEEISSAWHRRSKGVVPEELIKDTKVFIETNFAPEVIKISAASEKINDFNKNLEQLIAEEREKVFEDFKKEIEGATYSLKDIITTNRNKDTGALLCKASITAIIDKDNSINKKITYSIEKTSDSKIYAEVKSIN